jgi:hypothetical protein
MRPAANSRHREALVLRRDLVSSLIATDRAAEYAALIAFSRRPCSIAMRQLRCR